MDKDIKISPPFKYMGGKTWLKEQLREEVHLLAKKSKKIDFYVEPFAGGLGSFLGIYDILIEHNIKNIILNDINNQLIYFYKKINENPQKLISNYMKLENSFKKTIPSLDGYHLVKDKLKIKELLEEAHLYYKKIKTEYNSRKIKNLDTSAYIMFLQNHSFNGIYRENSSGQYNTPFNWSGKVFKKEQIEQKIMNIKHVFEHFNIEFTTQSYDQIDYKLNAIYYLDPPYLNDIETQENKYNKDAFGIKEQENLIKNIANKKFIYSNHQSNILEKFFIKYHKKLLKTSLISRKNIVSSSVESRKKDKIEILISS